MLEERVSKTRRLFSYVYILFILAITTVPRVKNFYLISSGSSGTVDLLMLGVTAVYIVLTLMLIREDSLTPSSRQTVLSLDFLLIMYAGMGILTQSLSRVRSTPMEWLGLFTGNGAASVALACAVVLLIGRNIKSIKDLVVPIAIFVVVQDAIIFVQLLGFNPFWLYGESDFYGTGIITNIAKSYAGTIGNIGLLSNVSGMLAVFLMVMYFQGGLKMSHRIIAMSAGCITIWVTVLLGTSAVLVGYCVVLAVLGYLYMCRKTGVPYTVTVLFVVLGISAVAILYFVDIPVTTLHEVHEILHGNASGEFGSSRVAIWSEFIEAVKGEAVFGKGLDSAGLDGLGYFVRIDDATQTVFRGMCVDGHSKWINILYGGGILTLLPFVLYFVVLFYYLFRKYVRTGRVDVLACTLAVVFWVTVWSFSVSYINVDCVFYCVLGMAHSILREEQYA